MKTRRELDKAAEEFAKRNGVILHEPEGIYDGLALYYYTWPAMVKGGCYGPPAYILVDVETGDVSEIPESWDHSKISYVLQNVDGLSTMKRKMKTVRWTATCEDMVLHDEDSLYKHFTLVPYFRPSSTA